MTGLVTTLEKSPKKNNQGGKGTELDVIVPCKFRARISFLSTVFRTFSSIFFPTTFSRVYRYFPGDFGRLFLTADHITRLIPAFLRSAETLGRGGNWFLGLKLLYLPLSENLKCVSVKVEIGGGTNQKQ